MPCQPGSGSGWPGPFGVRGAARAEGLVRNGRGPSGPPTSGKDPGYKPMVKSEGGQRESDGVVVSPIGVEHNAPGGKGPDFGHACGEGKRKGMAGTARLNHRRVVLATSIGCGRCEMTCGDSNASYGTGPSSLGGGVSTPCMTGSIGVTS